MGAVPPAWGTGRPTQVVVAIWKRLREVAPPMGAVPPAGGTGRPTQAMVAALRACLGGGIPHRCPGPAQAVVAALRAHVGDRTLHGRGPTGLGGRCPT